MKTNTDFRLTPFGDRIVVSPIDEKKVGGVIRPDGVKTKSSEGVVIAIGKESVSEAKLGDRVMYGKYAGVEIHIEDLKYVVLHQDDILGFVAQ